MVDLPENPEEAPPASTAPGRGDPLAVAIATAFGAGHGPIAPGTWGSAAALPLFALLAALPPGLYTVLTVAVLTVGVWAADRAERVFGKKDDGRIVIDEVAGQLVTLAPLLALRGRDLDPVSWLAWVVTGFVVFRLLDIWKPGPARWAERSFPGGAGVVLDDVVAGLLGAVLMGAGVLVARIGGIS